ncbi:MAG: hypothetical protein ACKOK8_06390, partial [Planctomycetia bacterium]
ASSTPEKQKRAATHYLRGIANVPVEVELGEHTVQAKIVSRPLGKHRVAYVLAVKGMPAVIAADGGDAGAEDAQPAGQAGTTELAAAPNPAVRDQLADGTAGDGGTGVTAEAAAEVEQEDDLSCSPFDRRHARRLAIFQYREALAR